MKKIFLPFLLTCFGNVFGQKFAYKSIAQIDSFVNQDRYPYRFQLAATDYSFIGEYEAALNTYDKELDNQIVSKPTQKQKQFVSQFKPVDAKKYILQQAAKTRIIVFNEAHWQPMHRAFVKSLLSELQNIGYNFIGIEALDYSDTLLSKRKYPIINSGYYTREPGFGNLIRTALNLNFTLFPYDSDGQVPSEREIKEAENIKAIIDKNPTAKFIIYCGLDHCIEDSSHNAMIIPMAGRLKQMTGIDPLTIDQVELTERSNINFENAYRQLLTTNYDAVYINTNFDAFNKTLSRKVFDCNIYHPNTKFINGRPSWLYTSDKKFIDISKQITIGFPCLVKVYETSDNLEEAIPIDIIELKSKGDKKQIIVSNTNKFIVVISNRNGQMQTIERK